MRAASISESVCDDEAADPPSSDAPIPSISMSFDTIASAETGRY
jgi:hypothetical protein